MSHRGAGPAAHFTYAARLGLPGRLGRLLSAGHIVGGRGVPGRGARAIDAFALMLVYRGTGVYRDHAGERPLGPGSAVLVVPGHPHWYGVVGRDSWDEVYLTFEGPAFDSALAAGLLSPAQPVRRVTPVPYWRDRVDGFRTRRPPTTASGADHEVCDLLRLLVDVGAGAGSRGLASGGWRGRSEALLVRDLGEPLVMTDVAAAVGMAYETWRKKFLAVTGVSPGRYRVRDEHHFSKQFRRHVGVTPSQFRRDQG